MVATGALRDEVEVLRVIDGDSIEVRFSSGAVATVRYIGIATPKAVAPTQPVICFGQEATAKNTDLVAGKWVHLERDVTETDRDGRLLRYVWVKGRDGGLRLVNEELVKWGFAQVASAPPDVTYQEIFLAAQRVAEAEHRGLWGACRQFGTPAPGAVAILAASGGRPGGRAAVTVQAAPGATCALTFVTPLGTVSQAPGLGPQQVPASGRVTWAWEIASNTRPGTGRVTVACTPGGQTAADMKIG
jgi:endonuclease YncB( thermonuclease family)